ncbi:alpha/beta hydrolase [uncultured Maricaulis sp.]|uniref:alpha/beta hydrolase n=1 Tax=uncultured Maricaulis sp. TaxID=174710 RepID=UPI002615001E|nr:alpha/beta hydrolase [uncultured Maricaulis sp.]
MRLPSASSWPVLALALILLAACTTAPAHLPIMPTDVAAGVSEPILIATTRTPSADPDIRLTADRSALSFARADVWVPANRLAGEITYPSRQADPAHEFGLTGYQANIAPSDWSAMLDRHLSSMPLAERQVFVFVHGFNTPFSDGLYLNAQILNDFGVRTAAVHYAWPSAGQWPAYLYDRDSAQFARDGLVETLQRVSDSPAVSITILAHSMGSLVTMEALRQLSLEGRRDVLAKLDPVILASPDIDFDIFLNQLDALDPPPAHLAVLVSDRDRVLALSDSLRGGNRTRLGIGHQRDVLVERGIAVIDLTGLRDGTFLGHVDFATSETLMQLAASGALSQALNGEMGQSRESGVGALSDIAARIIYLPARALGER